jgi:hypothetical protein
VAPRSSACRNFAVQVSVRAQHALTMKRAQVAQMAAGEARMVVPRPFRAQGRINSPVLASSSSQGITTVVQRPRA